MFILVPKWAHYYDDFWKAIRTNNLWFIKLRFSFVGGLILFLLAGEFLLDFKLTSIQIKAILIITVSILIFNTFIFFIRKYIGQTPGKFNVMHLSLAQMIFDLAVLMVLVHFTGMNQSPLSMFFIFHMIIGSIILPTHVVFTVAGVTSLVFSLMILLQNFGITETYIIQGLFPSPIDHSLAYDILYITVFSVMLIFSVYLAHSITSRLYKREQQLRETLIQLDESEVTKQKYIMGVVHEIKTPIVAVQSILDLLLNRILGPIDEKINEKLARARTRSEEAINLINNVLRISLKKLFDERIDSEIEFEQVFEKLIGNLSETASRKNIKIKFTDRRTKKTSIKGDTTLIELAMSNLLGNAIKYGNHNGRVNAELSNFDSENLLIEIIDDGIGIPPDEILSVFDEFYRATNITDVKAEGTGLGLSLVKEIIEEHQGIIKVKSPSRLYSEERPGTEFLITLPLKREKMSKIDLDKIYTKKLK